MLVRVLSIRELFDGFLENPEKCQISPVTEVVVRTGTQLGSLVTGPNDPQIVLLCLSNIVTCFLITKMGAPQTYKRWWTIFIIQIGPQRMQFVYRTVKRTPTNTM
jgi:hypothetical protein